MRYYHSGTSVFLLCKLQWAPTLTAHDPNPPITLEDAPKSDTYPAWFVTRYEYVDEQEDILYS